MQPFNRFRLWRIAISLIVVGMAWTGASVRAEGSAELVVSGGNRPFMDMRPDFTGGIPRLTTISVYVNAGEAVLLGSSTANRLGNPTQDITWDSPGGTDDGACNVITNGIGFIANPAMEAAGPLPTPGGYNPGNLADPDANPTDCVFRARETGIYDVRFWAGGTGNPIPALASDPFPPGTGGSVSAWDVTVRTDPLNPATTIRGRAFTNFLALNTGSRTGAITSRVYVLTRDGFLYNIDLNGMQPFAFVIFGNNKGFINTTTQEPLYRSVQLTTTDQFIGTDGLYNPALPDDPVNNHITMKLFFNPPASDLPTSPTTPIVNRPGGSTWLVTSPPISPQAPTALRFIGSEGLSNQADIGSGGQFEVDIPANFVGTVTLSVDVNNSGPGEDDEDLVFLRSVDTRTGPQTLVFDWDGRDRQGNIVGVNQPFSIASSTYLTGGETHFPFLDAESNINGIIIQRLNGPSIPGVPFNTVYYDDSHPSLITFPDHIVPSPLRALTGIDSTGGIHAFGTTDPDPFRGWGDHKGIDTWTAVPSPRLSIDFIRIGPPIIPSTPPQNPPPAGPPAPPPPTPLPTNNGPFPPDFTNAREQGATSVVPVPSAPGGQARLDVAQTVDRPFASFGDIVTWRITITNPSDVLVGRVFVVENTPPNTQPLRWTTSAGTLTIVDGIITFEIDQIAPGQTIIIDITTLITSQEAGPFILENRFAGTRARVITANQLPSTGESPVWRSNLSRVARWMLFNIRP